MNHISIRVPWHDNGWNGRYCLNPSCNTFCKVLPNIALSKKEWENNFANQKWGLLPQKNWPACYGENGGFMNDYPYPRFFEHRYSHLPYKIPHRKLLPTEIEIPPYCALGVPYRYLLKSEQSNLQKKHPEFHPDEEAPFPTGWVFGRERLNDILSWFKNNLGNNESICVFYCKGGNPIDDQGKRLITGIGDISNVHPVLQYKSSSNTTYPFWEILLEHSIRENLKESNGFLIPYQKYLEAEEDYVKEVTGFSKEEALNEIKLSLDTFDNDQQLLWELSYGCDYISNQSMLKLLEASRSSILAIIRHGLVGGDWQRQLRWINDSIAKVKLMISPFPSFAEVLKAIGINYSYLIEEDIRKNGCGSKDNPWYYFDKLMNDQLSIVGQEYKSELPYYKDEWQQRKGNGDIEFLELISRFELPDYIIKDLIKEPSLHPKVIENPYIIAERNLIHRDFTVTTQTIDFGIIKDPEIQGQNLPEEPSVVTTPIDKRRIRSFIVEKLSMALEHGDTLLSITEILENLDIILEKENIELPSNFILSQKEFFSEVMDYISENGNDFVALQLKDYRNMEVKLSKLLLGLANMKLDNPIIENWEDIAKSSDYYNPDNQNSIDATIQQVKALEMMSVQKLSVLTGGAGTGKTAVVKTFLSSSQILNEGVLLLAPTGKARVRLEKMSEGRNVQAQTVAQFLLRRGRLDENMNSIINAKGKKFGSVRNIIVDECSMLTLNDMYVLLDSIDFGTVYRIIFIGDPFQLPPIGPGRPFADLCNYLLNPKNNLLNAIIKLSVTVRTTTNGISDILTLASWFSGDKPKKESTDIFQRIESNNLSEKSDLSVHIWEDENDILAKLKNTLCDELNVSENELGEVLREQIGIDNISELSKNPDKLENFQVITPVLNPIWGSYQINDKFQEWLGTKDKDNGIQFKTQILFPDDKVMLCKNEKEHEAYPSKVKYQLSNGQIGFVKKNIKTHCNITFANIPNETFGYDQDRSDDSERLLELAYAITTHKSQGSDFKITLIVLPKGGQFISRELIYTALTRAKDKAILLIQDNINWLREKSKPQYSELGHRNTNMFQFSVREQKLSIPYVEGLIHRSKHKVGEDYLYVRSKSEAIIVNELESQGIDFEYEQLLECKDGKKFIPDFTFSDMFGKRIIWEHLGMLGVAEYKSSWENKLMAYKEAGYSFEKGNLFTSEDNPNGSIDTVAILEIIEKIKDKLS